MEKHNPFWCDDCNRSAEHLNDVLAEDVFWNGDISITWCPGCGRLDDEQGTVTPKQSNKAVSKATNLIVKALLANSITAKQQALEEALEALEKDVENYYEMEPWRRSDEYRLAGRYLPSKMLRGTRLYMQGGSPGSKYRIADFQNPLDAKEFLEVFDDG